MITRIKCSYQNLTLVILDVRINKTMEKATCTQCNKVFPFKDRFWFKHDNKEVEICTPQCLSAWRRDHPPIVETTNNHHIQHIDYGGRASY